MRARQCIWAAAGTAQNREAGQAKVVGESLDIGGPVRDAAVGLEGGEAEPGAVGGDDAEVAAASDMIEAPALEAR